jgi:hypothetical protein
LIRELSAESTAGAENRLLAKYLKPDLLIIDDMGLKVLPPKGGEILLEILMRRYENRSTLMTSNRPIEEWGKLLCDMPAASARALSLRGSGCRNLALPGHFVNKPPQPPTAEQAPIRLPNAPSYAIKNPPGVVHFEVTAGGAFSSDRRQVEHWHDIIASPSSP